MNGGSVDGCSLVLTVSANGTCVIDTEECTYEETVNTITYELDGGINSEANPDVFTMSSETIVLQAPTKEHYDFIGWYANPELEGDAITSIAQGTSANVTLYAKWQAKTYTVTYTDGVDGAEIFADTDIEAAYNTETPSFGENPTREGYIFVAWDKEIASAVTGNITYKAVWRKDHEHNPVLVEGSQSACQSSSYYECKDCGYFTDEACQTQITDIDVWKENNTVSHNFTEQIQDKNHLVIGTGIHCQEAVRYYYDCINCDTIGTTEWESNIFGEHKMDTSFTTSDGKHYHVCLQEDCDYTTEKVACSITEATCNTFKQCSVCGKKYGELNADNHEKEPEWIRSETKHEQKYSCCQKIVVEETTHTWTNGKCSVCEYVCTHTWENGVCSVCQYQCSHSGGTATCKTSAQCSVCGENYGEVNANNHEANAEWTKSATTHKQSYPCCQAVAVAEADHAWTDGVCSVCEYVCAHIGGEATCKTLAKCSVCGEDYGELDPEHHEKTAKWFKTATTHEKKYACCQAVTISKKAHNWKDGVCSACKYECSHYSGTATCSTLAQCSVCGENYGVLNANHHEANAEWTKSEATHEQKYSCCQTVVITEANHTWANGVCSVCEYTCAHSGGEATCSTLAQCSACGESYGALNANNHEANAEWTKSETMHEQKYSCCQTVVIAKANHTWANGVCSVCEYVCAHSGGTATCSTLAKCSVCGENYGVLNANNHEANAEWIKTETMHEKKYACCQAEVIGKEAHGMQNGECAECGYICSHENAQKVIGQSASCTVDGWNDYYACECGKYFADESGATVIADLDAWKANDGKIMAGHQHASAWKNNETSHWNECSCGDQANVAEHTDENKDGLCDICEAQAASDLGAGAIIAIVLASSGVLGIGGFALVYFVIKKKSLMDLIASFKKN